MLEIFLIVSPYFTFKTTHNEAKFWLQLDTLIWENQDPDIDAGPYMYFEKKKDGILYEVLFETAI